MLSIVYSPDLEIIGAIVVILATAWMLAGIWNEAGRARDRRRRRQRKRIERALVARTRCADCGSPRLVVEAEPASNDRERVADAIAGYVRRARTEASAR